MTSFFYAAKDGKGNVHVGTFEAGSLDEARMQLQGRGWIIDEVHQATMEERRIYGNDTLTFSSPNAPPSVLSGLWDEKVPAPIPQEKPRVTAEEKEESSTRSIYYPLLDTLRLYAGWLLAWYCLVYALGAYQHTRHLPFEIPFVIALLPPYSPLVLSFALATFLFLLLTAVHRALRGGILVGIALALLGMLAFAIYHVNA